MSILDNYFQTYGMPALQYWFGVTVTLQRGDESPTPSVPATWSRPPDGEVDEDDSFSVGYMPRVYRIAAAQYKVGGVAVAPLDSDRITETINGVEHVFAVMPIGRLASFELDGDGVHWLVRTKRVP